MALCQRQDVTPSFWLKVEISSLSLTVCLEDAVLKGHPEFSPLPALSRISGPQDSLALRIFCHIQQHNSTMWWCQRSWVVVGQIPQKQTLRQGFICKWCTKEVRLGIPKAALLGHWLWATSTSSSPHIPWAETVPSTEEVWFYHVTPKFRNTQHPTNLENLEGFQGITNSSPTRLNSWQI